MPLRLKISFHFIRHLVKARSRFDLHSPFIYKFYKEVIRNKATSQEIMLFENLRSKLQKDPGYIKMSDLGSGSEDVPWCRRLVSVRHVIRTSSITSGYGQLLFRISERFHPATILELGTSLGMSTAYLAMGNPAGRVITIEGCAETTERARKNFQHLGISNIRQVVGAFDEVLPGLLPELKKVDLVFIDGNHRKESVINYFSQCLQHFHEDSVLILDDIHWSGGMEEAWKEIRLNPSVTLTIDLFHMGIVFFNKALSKENFIIRF